MKFLRTDDQYFENLPDYPFAPNYCEIDDSEGGTLRLHYIDDGERTAEPILLMHGEPSWSYLYRKIIPLLVNAGYRVIAPDLIGFGRSDKPSKRADYTYQRHVDWMKQFLFQLNLNNITLYCQDWGGLIGLRLVAENAEYFSRVIAANTMLPNGEHDPGEAFKQWQQYSQQVPVFDAGAIIQKATLSKLTDEEIAAYNAPFPDETYKEGARQFPLLVPISRDDPASKPNKAAWQQLIQWQKPFLTAFSDSDPITVGGDKVMQKLIPGTQKQPHTTIEQAGHFLQEDQPEVISETIINFIQQSS